MEKRNTGLNYQKGSQLKTSVTVQASLIICNLILPSATRVSLLSFFGNLDSNLPCKEFMSEDIFSGRHLLYLCHVVFVFVYLC